MNIRSRLSLLALLTLLAPLSLALPVDHPLARSHSVPAPPSPAPPALRRTPSLPTTLDSTPPRAQRLLRAVRQRLVRPRVDLARAARQPDAVLHAVEARLRAAVPGELARAQRLLAQLERERADAWAHAGDGTRDLAAAHRAALAAGRAAPARLQAHGAWELAREVDEERNWRRGQRRAWRRRLRLRRS